MKSNQITNRSNAVGLVNVSQACFFTLIAGGLMYAVMIGPYIWKLSLSFHNIDFKKKSIYMGMPLIPDIMAPGGGGGGGVSGLIQYYVMGYQTKKV